MTGKEWLEVIENFFYDGHKEAREEYVLQINGESYDYYVPDYFDQEWTDFTVRLELDHEDDVLTAEEVYNLAVESKIEITIEILNFLEKQDT